MRVSAERHAVQAGPEARGEARVLTALAVAVLWAGAAWLTVPRWPERLPWLCVLLVAGVGPPLVAIGSLARLPPRRVLLWLLAGGALLRFVLLPMPPLLSDDIYRYIWDGKVLAIAGKSPFGVSPLDPALAPLRDELHARINFAALPTIYPPLAQAIFAGTVALGGGLTALKAVMSLADLAVVGLLFVLLAERRALAVLYAWHPLAVMESAGSGHVDAACVALMLGALLALRRARSVGAGALLALAASVKLIPVVLAPLLRRLRSLLVFAAALWVLVVLPVWPAGRAGTRSLEEVARRWRMNASVYSVVHAAVYRATVRPGGSLVPIPASPRVEALVGGRGWTYVLADDIASLAARLTGALATLLAAAYALRRRLAPEHGAFLVLAVMLAFSPTVHPWYVLWVLPLAILRPSTAWVAFSALMPLTYLPLAGYLRGGTWEEPLSLRVAVYTTLYGGWLAETRWPRMNLLASASLVGADERAGDGPQHGAT